jgi:glycosyltransferase involved in cell wall biosynthesis
MTPIARRQARISVVTVSYNKGLYIEECLRSVLEQDCAGVEYVVVDAGSNDGSREVIRRHADRIDVLIEEPDRGPADGLNKGFAQATADLYGYLNADDRYLPGTLSYVVNYFDAHPEIDVLMGAIRIIDERGEVSWRKRTSDLFDLTDYAAGLCVVGQQATFFRERAFTAARGFNVANRIAWDGELLVDMALAGQRFANVHKVLGDFRVYSGSITGSREYREQLETHREDIRRKLGEHRVRMYSPREQRLRRILYKFNLARHLGYFLVG